MSSPIRKDSIAKCDRSNDIFAQIRSPNKLIKAEAKPQDTLASLREKQAGVQVGRFSQNFMIAAKAGKYLFLVVALPPYFLLYGMPKWMIGEAMPFLFHFTMKPFQQLNKKLRESLKPHETNKNVLTTLKNFSTSALIKGAEYIKWIEQASKALFVHFKHRFIDSSFRLLQPYFPALKRGFEAAEAVTKNLLQNSLEKGDQQAELTKRFVSTAWKVAKEEVSEWLAPFVESIQEKWNDTKKQLEKLLDKPRAEIEKFQEAIKHQLKRVHKVAETVGLNISKTAESAVAMVTYVARPIVEWTAPKFQQITQQLHAGREKVGQHFERMRGFLQNVSSGLMDAMRASRQAVVTTVKQTIEVTIPGFVKKFFNFDRGSKKHQQQFMKALHAKAKKIQSSIKNFFVDQMQSAKGYFSQLLQKVQNSILKFLHQLKSLPKRSLQFVITSYHKTIRFFIATGQAIEWFFVISRILSRLAWKELREITSLVLRQKI